MRDKTRAEVLKEALGEYSASPASHNKERGDEMADGKKRFVFDPTINLGQGVAAAAFLVAAATGWNALVERIVVLEQARATLAQQFTEYRKEQKDSNKELRTDIKDIQTTVNNLNQTLMTRNTK